MGLSRPAAAAESAPWTQEYDLHYLTYQTLEMRVTVPGVVKVTAILAYVSDMNLSTYLTMLINWVRGREVHSRLDQCLSCFACGKMKCDRSGTGEHFVFCADEQSVLPMTKKTDVTKPESYADRCLKLQVANQCAQHVSVGHTQHQRLLEIIEECQTLVRTDAQMA